MGDIAVENYQKNVTKYLDIWSKEAIRIGNDLKAVNTRTAPNRVSPRSLGQVEVEGQRIAATLAPASWNVIELSVGP